MYNPFTLLEAIEDYAKTADTSLLYFRALGIEKCEHTRDVDKLNAIYSFYEEILPPEIYDVLFHSSFGFLKYKNSLTAQVDAELWFPTEDFFLDDERKEDRDYWVYCSVIEPNGIYYENVRKNPSTIE